jgi:hypothetical protein
MKRNLIIITLLTAASLFGNNAMAQQAALAPDQNPRYHESANKYRLIADSLTRTQGTTVQNTYKAYDWYTAREERRQQNRQWRSMYGGYYNSPGWSLYGGYSSYYPFYSSFGNYGWGNRWGGWGNGGWGGRGGWGVGLGFGW